MGMRGARVGQADGAATHISDAVRPSARERTEVLSHTNCGAKRRCSYDLSGKAGEGVLVGALQSEREEETRDRAERGSVVRGSDQASVAPKRTPSRD